jgi:hypothetical protein
MALVQGPLLLHSCTFNSIHSSYGDAHPSFWILSPSYSNKFGCQLPPLVLTWFVLVISPPIPLFSQSIPHQRGKPKRAALWYQNRAAMANRHPPSFAPVLRSSPQSSTQSSQNQTSLPPLSLPWDFCIKCFDLHGNSLDITPRPLPKMAWTLQSVVAHRSCPPPCASSPPPSPTSIPLLEDGNESSK